MAGASRHEERKTGLLDSSFIFPVESGVPRNEEPVMARSAHLLLILTLLGGTLTVSRGYAQTAADQAAPATGELPPTPEPEFLKTFPRPPGQPTSLLAPPPPPGPPPPDLERPYFQPDPLLDPPALGPIGWFADVDIGILKPHLVNQLSLPVTFPSSSPPATGNVPGIPPGVTTSAGQNFISPPMPAAPLSVIVGVNSSHLNWTVSPRFEVGYRLPSGFGGIALAYRFLVSQGSEGVIGADGPATLSSRLNANVVDLDWVSHEYVLWAICEMRVRFGLRYLNVYFDSQANEPFAEAAAGSTIFNQRTTDSTWVIGPHAGVDLRRRLGFWGLAILGFVDISEGWGRVRQNYFVFTTSGTNGLPQAAQDSISSSDAVPVLTARLGLNWQPPAYANIHLFAGYQLDYWWNIGRMGSFTTFGYFFDSGIVLRGEWNF
jgi:hypothetical protein